MSNYSPAQVTIDLQEYNDLKASSANVHKEAFEDFLSRIIVNRRNPGMIFDFNNFSSQLRTSLDKFGLTVNDDIENMKIIPK